MNKKVGWILGLLALILTIGGASVLYSRMSEDAAPPPVTTAPPTEAETTEEETVEPVAAPDFTVFNNLATYFVNAEGNLVAYGIGPLNLEALETGIGMLNEAD